MIEIGSRVKIRKEAARTFIQPWRGRFERGRVGTVVASPSANVRGWLVEWDHGKTKYPHDWRMVVRHEDLVIADTTRATGGGT